MTSNNEYIRKILNSHGVIVRFDGTPRTVNIPKASEKKETLKKWKDRVLGPDVTNVEFYCPTKYEPQTLMESIRSDADASQIKAIIKAVKTTERAEKKDAIEREAAEKEKAVSIVTKQKKEAVTRVKKESNSKAISVPIDDILDIVEEMSRSLHNSVYESMIAYVKDNKSRGNCLKNQDLFSELLKRYNSAVVELAKAGDKA